MKFVSDLRQYSGFLYCQVAINNHPGLGLGFFKPLSTIFQLYGGGQFFLVEETGVPEENRCTAASH
jgi:hypothetical protein